MRVEACAGLDEFAHCDYRNAAADPAIPGVCHACICDPCTTELAGCTYPGWTQMTSATNEELFAVSAVGDADVDAVGARGTYVHYDGKVWEPMHGIAAVSPASTSLLAIWRGGGVKLVLDANGELFRAPEHTDEWTKVAAIPATDSVTAMSAVSATDVIVVGLGVIYQFDGTTLSLVTPTPISSSFSYKAVWADPDGTVWAVHGEPVGRRVWVAMSLMVGAGILLALDVLAGTSYGLLDGEFAPEDGPGATA